MSDEELQCNEHNMERCVKLLAMVAIAFFIASRTTALGCDTGVALPDATAERSVIPAKNSDRPPMEAQVLVQYPQQRHAPGFVAKEIRLAQETGRPVVPILVRDMHNPLLMDLQHIDGPCQSRPPARTATLWSLGYPRPANVDVLHYRSSIPGGKA